MDKNAIKKFAVWARRELIERVSQKAMQYGIEKDNIVDVAADSVGGKVLTDTQKNQRRALISQINAKGYEEVMEEVAYLVQPLDCPTVYGGQRLPPYSCACVYGRGK